jgi:hypothetical protein
MAIKRLHYFNHQFLVEADFTDEQTYHLDMRRRLNRLLYTFGIAEGLEVAKSADKTVTVRPGVALDRLGREIIVEVDHVVDLSNATQFPANATVVITVAYQEQESDPTTATGVSGNTRITEQPNIQAVTTAPPTDGTVIRLASFTLDASANVPGNINDLIDGGVRQTVRPRGQQGLASIDDVSNPGGNVDLVPAQAIVITPNDANNQITIGENHSTLTNNPHNVTAEQIGALGQHEVAEILFTNLDGNNATRQVVLNFQPRIVLVVGICNATLGTTRIYGGGVAAFADFEANPNVQRGFGVNVTRNSDTDWSSQPLDTVGIASARFSNANPPQGERLSVVITSVSQNELIATLTRTLLGALGTELPGFVIRLQLLCMG